MSTAFRRPQLNLDELRRLKWLLGGALALVSLWTVFFLDIEALSLVGCAGAAIVAVLIWPQIPSKVPAIAWRLAVPAIIVSSSVDFALTPEKLPVLIRLGILLVLYRAVSYRRRREDLQLILLGLFLIVSAGVLTVSLGFGFLLLLFTACALAFLFVVTLVEMSEPEVSPVRVSEAGPPAWARLGWRRWLARLGQAADWRLIGLAGVLFCGVVAMSAFLFLIIPRFELATGFFLDKAISRKSRTGFSETVRFGDVTELVRDDSVAMRVDLTDAASLKGMPYWRVVVLDEYQPQGFRISAGIKRSLIARERVNHFVRGRTGFGQPGAAGGLWTVYLEPGVSRFLPLPGSFLVLRLRDSVPVQANPQLQLVALRSEPLTMTAFLMEGVEPVGAVRDSAFANQLASARAGAAIARDAADPRLCLAVPEGSANTAILRRVVAEITGGRPLPAGEFSQRASAWLRSHHRYAMAARIPAGGADDIVKWLDSTEPGFCEYFASALAVLSRAAGHPARVIAGYHGGAINAFENYLMVRNSDAHAWCEVFDGRDTWVRVDPTLGARADDGRTESQFAEQLRDSSWSARWDSLRVIWYRRIVNFDQRTQVAMVDQVRSFTSNSGQAIRARMDAWGKALKEWLAQPWSGGRMARVFAWLIGIAAGLWVFGVLVRSAWTRWRAWRRPGEYDPVRREAGRWLARLAWVEGWNGEPGPPLRASLLRLRFGPRGSWPDPRLIFREAKRAMKKGRRGGEGD